MKKEKILLAIMIALIIIAMTLLAIKERKYTQKDVDRALNIYLENKKANVIDYIRLDMDHNYKIDLTDVMIVNKKVLDNE